MSKTITVILTKELCDRIEEVLRAHQFFDVEGSDYNNEDVISVLDDLVTERGMEEDEL